MGEKDGVLQDNPSFCGVAFYRFHSYKGGILTKSKRRNRNMPKVEIRSESCKACEYCIVTCPKKVLAIGAANNSKGYHYVVPANPDACIGCKLCAIVCPDAAIEVYK